MMKFDLKLTSEIRSIHLVPNSKPRLLSANACFLARVLAAQMKSLLFTQTINRDN